ncbi:hypothetical protein BC827DRAFT_1239385 [Russula dissimulans]|jgi:Ankyrin repeat|nr:hypothetical protein BC827DRAFT_1239385 [Russula dissimulans]
MEKTSMPEVVITGLGLRWVQCHARDTSILCGYYATNVNATTQRNETPLSVAYANEHFDMIRLLLERHPVPDYVYMTDPRPGQVEVVRLLLQRKIDVKIIPIDPA